MEKEETNPRRSIVKPKSMLLALYVAAVLIGLYQILSDRMTGDGSPISGFGPEQPAVAIVPIYGMITVSNTGQWTGSSTADRLTRRLKSLSERSDVKAVVLRINSPGGTVAAVQEVHHEVMRLRKTGKKVIVSMGDVAASGGYYIAAAADRIFADPGTLTGSIGVIFQMGDFRELFKKIGVKVNVIKSAEHKDIASPFRAMTPKERRILQSVIDDAYGQFVRAVVEGRNMEKARVLKLADGRIFTGAQALSAGLVDELGSLQTAISRAVEIAGIKVKPRILYDRDPLARILSLLSRFGGAGLWDDSPLSLSGARFAYVWEYALK